ncbi:hypothetical protein GGI04_000211 [Coemansia thaxteri]|uniref:AB hydrolase-1 domain-containing protein n=1 Tax=Coemansia thaxteri TaxID=2663907 RepID=A0A9W8BKC0_9FUNG|nr:hypothetical protein H4R26_000369 [Coemansia thaxteri]KAJ2009721.1 hypothetical protein GGI04_000211 [Coemansia thaxteri]KAJ2474213.1 hypothetical protein GGI02_000258 [Coemansia sp. RSA 2322]KAJ2486310.1 hypothetical protein EV174_001181 [Coemansia sp. RSA 2320]
MSNILSIDTTMPGEAGDSPIWDHLAKRGHVDIGGQGKDAAPLHIYYELYGTGSERVVFINGMGADRQMWEPNVSEFLKLGKYQCLVYDNRGTGFSGAGAGPVSFTSSAMATDLKLLMTAIGWGKANVVGVSMGGMIALEFACTYPNLVKTLTLTVTNAGLAIPPMRGIMDTVTSNFTSDPRKRFEGICGTIYTQEYLESPAPENSGCKTMLDYCTMNAVRKSRYSRPMSLWSFVGQIGLVFRHYIAPARLEQLGRSLPDKQILIVTGDEDHLVRTSNSLHLAEKIGLDNVIFKIYKGAGHGLNSQESVKFTRDIDAMITAVDSDVRPIEQPE